jgi:hypothetical protein
MRKAMRGAVLTCAVFVLGLAGEVPALTQPNGSAVPTPLSCQGGQPVGLMAIFACQCIAPSTCNIGMWCPGSSPSCDPGTYSTCETTLWHTPGDNTCIPSQFSGLNAYTDGFLDPQTYRPAGPVTFRLLSRGETIFRSVFGWYNVTGLVPDLSDLHVVFDCNTSPGNEATIDLLSEPAYLGGTIGFFVISPEAHTALGTCASGNCCAAPARLVSGQGYAYYTERQFNPDFAGSSSWIHMIGYHSRLAAQRYFFAAEDFYGTGPGDFTSLVVSVSGINSVVTGVDDGATVPGAGSKTLMSVPNPFNPLTTIAYELSAPGAVQLTIYDAKGRLVRQLADPGIQTAGRHEAAWDGRSDGGVAMPSGVYFCRLEADGFAQTIKLALLK